MRFKRWALLVAVLASLSSARPVFAQDVRISQEDLKNLVKRLEAAESRINQLEGERSSKTRKIGAPEERPAEVGRSTYSPGTFRDASAVSDDPIMKRLETLETKWVDIEESNGKLQDQVDDYFVKDGGSRSNMTISGRIHGDYWAFPDVDESLYPLDRDGNPQDRFIWRRVRFGVKGDITDNMNYKIEMEFANPSNVQYRDLYVGFKNLSFLQTLLIGNQKRPFGLDHINSSRFNVFIERPFIIEAFNQDARRLGIASYGLSDDETWAWRFGLYNTELTQGDEGYTGDHYQPQLAGRLAKIAWWDDCTDGRSYWHLAASGSAAWVDGTGGPSSNNEGRFDTRPEARTRDDWLDTGRIPGANDYQQLGFESALNLGPLQLVGELEQTWLSRSGGDDLHFWGGYVYASYFLTGEHMPWDRKTAQLGRPKPFQNFFMVDTCDDGVESGWGAWQVAVRYSYADLSDSDINGGVGESLTLALNWLWNANSRLQFNYINGRIDGADEGLNGSASGRYQIIGTRFAVDF